MGRLLTLTFGLASVVVLAQAGPLPEPLPGAQLIETTLVRQPLELRPATADEEAVLAGQRYIQHTYRPPNALTAAVFVQSFRDSLFASGWKHLDATQLSDVPMQPETVNVAAHYRDLGANIYARFTLEPGRPYTVNVADIGQEDWASQLAEECRVRIYSIHFAHDRPIIDEVASEPTLRKLAQLINAKSTPAVRLEGYMDNVGEAGRALRQTLSLGRARMVVSWLTTHGDVPANKVAAQGLGHASPIADNDTDLGRALNRRIEVARTDCTR